MRRGMKTVGLSADERYFFYNAIAAVETFFWPRKTLSAGALKLLNGCKALRAWSQDQPAWLMTCTKVSFQLYTTLSRLSCKTNNEKFRLLILIRFSSSNPILLSFIYSKQNSFRCWENAKIVFLIHFVIETLKQRKKSSWTCAVLLLLMLIVT